VAIIGTQDIVLARSTLRPDERSSQSDVVLSAEALRRIDASSPSTDGHKQSAVIAALPSRRIRSAGCA